MASIVISLLNESGNCPLVLNRIRCAIGDALIAMDGDLQDLLELTRHVPALPLGWVRCQSVSSVAGQGSGGILETWE